MVTLCIEVSGPGKVFGRIYTYFRYQHIYPYSALNLARFNFRRRKQTFRNFLFFN